MGKSLTEAMSHILQMVTYKLVKKGMGHKGSTMIQALRLGKKHVLGRSNAEQ